MFLEINYCQQHKDLDKDHEIISMVLCFLWLLVLPPPYFHNFVPHCQFLGRAISTLCVDLLCFTTVCIKEKHQENHAWWFSGMWLLAKYIQWLSDLCLIETTAYILWMYNWMLYLVSRSFLLTNETWSLQGLLLFLYSEAAPRIKCSWSRVDELQSSTGV